eukprot:365578-Chlamydomonas_euryale.AAC.24
MPTARRPVSPPCNCTTLLSPLRDCRTFSPPTTRPHKPLYPHSSLPAPHTAGPRPTHSSRRPTRIQAGAWRTSAAEASAAASQTPGPVAACRRAPGPAAPALGGSLHVWGGLLVRGGLRASEAALRLRSASRNSDAWKDGRKNGDTDG